MQLTKRRKVAKTYVVGPRHRTSLSEAYRLEVLDVDRLLAKEVRCELVQLRLFHTGLKPVVTQRLREAVGELKRQRQRRGPVPLAFHGSSHLACCWLRWLHLDDLGSVACVSQQCRALLASNTVWKSLVVQNNNKAFLRLLVRKWQAHVGPPDLRPVFQPDVTSGDRNGTVPTGLLRVLCTWLARGFACRKCEFQGLVRVPPYVVTAAPLLYFTHNHLQLAPYFNLDRPACSHRKPPATLDAWLVWFEALEILQWAETTATERSRKLTEALKTKHIPVRYDTTVFADFVSGKVRSSLGRVVAVLRMTHTLFRYNHKVFSQWNGHGKLRINLNMFEHHTKGPSHLHRTSVELGVLAWCRAWEEVYHHAEDELDFLVRESYTPTGRQTIA